MRSKNLSASYMTTVYVIALLILAVIGGGRTYLEHKIIVHQTQAADLINTAGRQRMLSQRIGWLTSTYETATAARQQAIRSDIKTGLDRMESGHQALVNGEMRIPDDDALAPEIKDMYEGDTQHLNADLQRFFAATDAFLDAKTPADRATQRNIIESLATKDLIDKLDKVVSLYQENADQQGRSMAQMSLYGYIILLFITLGEALFIFRPAVNRITRQQAELMVYAHSDPLTGSFNRHTFFDFAAEAIDRARRYKQPISVLVIGIDHLNTLAERHGQSFGDDVLREFSSTVVPQLKSDDLFGRIAGDEFAIFMPGLDEKAAAAIAEDIRYNVSEHGMMFEGSKVPVTVSIGVAAVSGSDQHPAAATQKAEKALFIARHQGRDRVALFSTSEKDFS